MITQYAAALNTYLTRPRRLAPALYGLVVATVLVSHGTESVLAGPRELSFSDILTTILLPITFAMLFLTQQAKWQFVHPRARLTPHFARAHLGVLGGLLLAVLGIYPVVVALVLRVPILGVASFSVILGATSTIGSQTLQPVFNLVFNLTGWAVFLSMMIPQLRDIWMAPNVDFTPYRVAILLGGWAGIALWLRRLARMSEENDDFYIPGTDGFGQASRLENAEARRSVARVLSRAKLQSRVSDWWHDRLAGEMVHDGAGRRHLLRYGFSPVPVPFKAASFMLMPIAIVLVTGLLEGHSARMFGAEGVVLLFGGCLLGPCMTSFLLAKRRVRLSQELLLPLSRRSLVDGLFRATAVEFAWLVSIAICLALLATWLFAPELPTISRTAAVLIAILVIQPLLFASSCRFGLINSGMKRGLMMVLTAHAAILVGTGAAVLGIQVALIQEVALSIGLLSLGWWSIQAARERWMLAELG